MRESTRRALNDLELLAARERHLARLVAVFAGETPETPFFISGTAGFSRPESGACAGANQSANQSANGSAGEPGNAAHDPYTEPEAWVDDALDSLAECAGTLRDPDVFRPLCVEFGPYGVHYVDRMLGARVYRSPDGQWWVDYLKTPVGGLELPDLENDPTWTLSRRLALAFRAASVSVPFFGLPTIASPLNIAVNLYGPDLLMAMVESPDAVRHDLRVITDLQCALHRWYRHSLPEAQLQPVVAVQRCQPPGFGQICGCTTHLISAAMYASFVAPLDEALLNVYPNGGMIHLCGAHTQHIPVWRAMRALRAVQLNDRATEDFEAYYDGLRDDQVLYIIPTETTTIEKVLARTGGRRVILIAEPPGD